MELSINFDIVKAGWPMLYMSVTRYNFSENKCYTSFSEDRLAAFNLGLHCLQKYS